MFKLPTAALNPPGVKKKKNVVNVNKLQDNSSRTMETQAVVVLHLHVCFLGGSQLQLLSCKLLLNISDHYPISKGTPRLLMKECKCNRVYLRSYPSHHQVRENPHHAGVGKPLEEPLVKGLLYNLVPDKQPKLDELIAQEGSHPGALKGAFVQYCNHRAVERRATTSVRCSFKPNLVWMM